MRGAAVLLLFALALLLAPAALARPPVPAPVFKAVRANWTLRVDRVTAFNVVACETGGRYNTTADNGQYENIFQMGLSERRRFGWHVKGDSPMKAARAAHAYWRVSGWSPWLNYEPPGCGH